MKSLKHTSGPWPYAINDHAVSVDTGDSVFTSKVAGGDAEANARLIAAAPQLLTWSTDLISRLRALDTIMNALPKDAVETLHKLEDAIVKATGGDE